MITDAAEIGSRPYAAELHDLLCEDGEFRLNAVFLVEETPTICFVEEAQVPTAEAVDAIRQRLWNQNLASALLVISEGQIRAYSIPKWKNALSCDTLNHADAGPDGPWSAGEVLSSELQQRLEDWFDPSRRVDRDLLRQLSNAVTQLTSGEVPLIARQIDAQMLLAQVLFISYLEHRGIIGDEYRIAHELKTLREFIDASSGRDIDKLIAQLKVDFNGDFLEPSEITWAKLPADALRIVGRLLSRVDLETGQTDFWNYDFSQIPVELLSGIYETFLQDERKIDGAYYTPRVLAELAITQALSGIEDPTCLKVYDGACGSGILLTTAFRKIVAHKQSDLGRALEIGERISLLENTIYGGDVNRIACRVTAFSLYLCLLERLSQRDLVHLQQDHDCKLPKLIGGNIAEGKEHGDFFSDTNPFSASGKFDVVVSNPPWRELRNDEGANATEWAARNNVRMPHRQIAAAFAAKAVEAAKSGARIVLILPTSLITAPTNADFLRQFTTRVQLARMVNLADFRRLLFAQAEHACTVLVATNQPGLSDGRVEGHLEYLMPKCDISFAFNRLTLHDYDKIEVARASLVAGNDELRRRFWGSHRDEALFHRLSALPNLGDCIETERWRIGKGYHKKDGSKSINPRRLAAFPFLATSELNAPSLSVTTHSLQPVPVKDGVASYGDFALYEGPRVLWPDGTSPELEIRAAYSHLRFCFPSGVGALSVGTQDDAIARLLTCYLRSSLASYWLILTGYSAAAERARVTVKEIKSLPFIHPKRHSNEASATKLIDEAHALVATFETPHGQIFSENYYTDARRKLDQLIFDYFGLRDNERALIEDMVQLVAHSLQPTSYAELYTPLQDKPTADAQGAYVRELRRGLDAWSRRGKGAIRVSLVERAGFKTPLDIVHVALSDDASKVKRPNPHGSSIAALLEAIDVEAAQGRAIDFFAMPNSIFVWGNDVYLVKPSRMRFWTRSAALRDADEVVELLVGERAAAKVKSA
ncbi:N-6 DNA methylase [Acidocella facilis]|uniref:N-6 DNA methylase n=1 Tax=Acidocella facilis TaxID=525 RepID=UPI00138DF4AD|nr:N-6 DNA methylase [Acidocella facilis]